MHGIWFIPVVKQKTKLSFQKKSRNGNDKIGDDEFWLDVGHRE